MDNYHNVIHDVSSCMKRIPKRKASSWHSVQPENRSFLMGSPDYITTDVPRQTMVGKGQLRNST